MKSSQLSPLVRACCSSSPRSGLSAAIPAASRQPEPPCRLEGPDLTGSGSRRTFKPDGGPKPAILGRYYVPGEVCRFRRKWMPVSRPGERLSWLSRAPFCDRIAPDTTKPRSFRNGACIDNKIWRLPTLPHCGAVPSAMGGLTSLFGMGRGGDTPGKTTIRS